MKDKSMFVGYWKEGSSGGAGENRVHFYTRRVCSSALTCSRCQVTAAAHLSGRRTPCVCVCLSVKGRAFQETTREVDRWWDTHSVFSTCHIKPLTHKFISSPPSIMSTCCLFSFLLFLFVVYSTLLHHSLYIRFN